MNSNRWNLPVPVRDGQDIVFEIRSVRHAAEFLILHWPDSDRGSWKHLAAQIACLDVLESEREPEHARRAFVEAAKAAGILAEG
ncbi:DUF982 domain-containing protein [Chelativorans sp.]|uniref:DUF982 domain-containing protein n=1 Tax=Chelativorans sp. TaxID=2203393 RepID=UPI002810D562|nr:DUF982 domain-containing protein [Chelativorans sp.]